MRYLALLIFLVGCTTTPPDTTVLPGSTPTLLGGCASCDEGDAGIAAMETFLGRKVDFALAWGWADTKNNFEYSATWIKENHGSHKLVWSMPMIIHGTTFADCYNGTYDSSYTIFAQTVLSADPEAVIRTGHEMNGNWYDWSMDGPAGTAAEFAKCYAHIATVMRAVSPKFKMDWNPGAGMWAGMDSVRAYPGDEFVDIIGLDQYEDSQWTKGTPDERWNQFLDDAGRGLTFWADFAKTHKKMLAFDEWASNYDDGTHIQHMAEWMKANGNVHHQMYWNSESAFSGSFSTHPTNGAAFKKAFAP